MEKAYLRVWGTLVVLICAAGLLPSETMAAVRTVTNLNDGGTGSLRQIITSASAGDTIEFAVTGTITITSGDLFIPKSLTINGPGASSLIISGNDARRVFRVTTNNGTVVISGLTITHGADLAGGGVYTGGTILTLNDCVITGNRATRDGGGIYSGYFNGPTGDVVGSLKLNRCTISNNTATLSGGFGGGGIYQVTGSLEINDCSITGNNALSGGGIYAVAANSIINNSSVSGNNSIGDRSYSDPAGGGIYAAVGGTMSINNCTFVSNISSVSGGAILNAVALTVTNSTFSGNKAIVGGAIMNASLNNGGALTVARSTFSANRASLAGGAIVNFGDLTLVSSTLSGNIVSYPNPATPQSGGGLSNYGGNSTVLSSTFYGNVARAGGGIGNSSGSVTIRSTIIAGSSGADTGGAFTSQDYNLIQRPSGDTSFTGATAHDKIGVAPRLGPLQNNGGPTLTYAPLPDSPVLDAGSCGTGDTAVTVDQRNQPRPADFTNIANAHDGCDIGAVELGAFFIHGRISTSNGIALPNVRVSIGGTAFSALTNSAGYYYLRNLLPGTYTVTPSLTGDYFTPQQRTVTVTDGNVINQNFIGYRFSSIYGRVSDSSGQGLPNVTVTRSGSSTPVFTNSAGYYNFRDLRDGTYTITPTFNGYFFTPTTRTVTVGGADVANQNFLASTGYNVSGRIYTSNGSGVANMEVTISDGRSTPIVTNSAGYYTFRNVAPGTYTITPASGAYSFTPATRSVTIVQSDITSQNFLAVVR